MKGAYDVPEQLRNKECFTYTNTTLLVLLQNLGTVTNHLPGYTFTYEQAMHCKINMCSYSIDRNNSKISQTMSFFLHSLVNAMFC